MKDRKEKKERYDLRDELIRKCTISFKYRSAFHRSDDDSIVSLCHALDIKRYHIC